MTDFHRAEDAEERGAGICRTCLAPIWWEIGQIGHRDRGPGWSDRIPRGGDSLVCFKAVEYRHVPLETREAAIYDRAYQRGAESVSTPADDRDARLQAAIEALAEEWRYTGEHGWGPWQEGHGPDLEGQVLDEAAGRLRAVLTAVDNGDPGCGHCGEPLTGDSGYTGAAVYHRGCAREVYGDQFEVMA